MIKNFVTLAFRNFWRHKIFSLINILGLSIGISAALVIYLVVHYDFSFDRFQKDGDRIYRVVAQMHFPNQTFKSSGVPMPLPPAVEKEVTGVEMTVPLFRLDAVKIMVPGQNNAVYKKQDRIVMTDAAYFQLLSYEWLGGSAASLNDPFTVVLTESRAKLYFPDQDATQAIGQTLVYNDSLKLTVAGIVKDLREVTDFTFHDFISYSTIENSGLKKTYSWGQWSSVNSSSQLFVKLANGTKPDHVEKQLQALRQKYAKDDFMKTSFALQPLHDLHFNPDYENIADRRAHKPTLYGLLIIAGFILLLGCINFINLTTAQAVQRAKEIGIRKTVGSSKNQIIFQFLSETFLFTLLAAVLSLVLTPWLLHIFSDFIPRGVTIHMLQQWDTVFFLVLLVVAVSFLSGLYPAFVLSRHKPVLALKNQAYEHSGKSRKLWVRKTLSVAQFVIAQFFIMATLLVSKQIHYTLSKDLGFEKEGILTLHLPGFQPKPNEARVMLSKVQQLPEVQKAVLSGAPPAEQGYSATSMKVDNGKEIVETTVEIKYADPAYFDLYGMKLVAGKNLHASDSIQEYLINETYARFLGFTNPQDAVGKMIDANETKAPIAGVLADFYAKSLHEPMKPLAYASASSDYETIHIKLQPNSSDGQLWKTALQKLEQAWKKVYPDEDFSCRFLDENIARFYKSEQDISKLLTWATGITILISCLGLLGLVIYTTHQRAKEIGVRKVLGASVSQIVSGLSKDFVSLVVVAFVIAAPLAWWAIDKWLQSFAYRTPVSWWVFVVSGMGMILIAFMTLSYQTIKAALANPVKSLRTE